MSGISQLIKKKKSIYIKIGKFSKIFEQIATMWNLISDMRIGKIKSKIIFWKTIVLIYCINIFFNRGKNRGK